MKDAFPKNKVSQKRKNGKITIPKAKIDTKLIFTRKLQKRYRSLKLWIIYKGPNPSLFD